MTPDRQPPPPAEQSSGPAAAPSVAVLFCPAEFSGQRLDQALAALLSGRSRAFVKKVIDTGGVTVDGEPGKAARRMKGGEELRIAIPAPAPLEVKAEAIDLDVLYEDADLIVVNKRPGMVAHPSQGHHEGTLVNALLHHYGDSLSGIGGVLRPGIVHRLDKDTSGCLVAAKNDRAHQGLMEQFMSREVAKAYLAITDGVPRPVSGKVEGQIGRSAKNRQIHAMLKSGGRHSLTRYRTLENYGSLALVQCDLETGRTHQARVHLAHLGAPVLCDRDYGKREFFTDLDLDAALALFRTGSAAPTTGPARPARILLERQALHAWRLSFRHPGDGRGLAFEAPIPADMLAILGPLRRAKAEMA